ncbi:NADH-quinone oxidoreductase subunit N [bacterium]|nr:NADH-quinone oxidoreductase subunit N [bacterium]
MTASWLRTFHQMTPEAAVVLTLVWVVLSDLFLPRNPRHLWIQSFIGLCGATIAAILLFQVDTPAQALMPSIQWVFLSSPLTSAVKAVILLLATLSVAFAHRSFGEAERNAGEFYALILFSTLGALLCVSSQDLLMFFVSFELLSLPLYMLCAFRRYHSPSAEAGLKYFINGALSSAILLYGISWMYGSLGTTHLPTIAMRYAELEHAPAGLYLGCLMILAGLAFKVAAAPFHNWAPDVYSGAPPAVSVFLSTAPKVAMVGFIVRLFWGFLDGSGLYFQLGTDWVFIFVILSVVSMFVGNLSALPQTDVRKILAYSGIAQIGYLFLGLAACSQANPHPDKALAAVLFYVTVYGISNLGAWAVLTVVGRERENLDFSSLKGLHQRNPLLAACLALCLMSLAGVPPLSGFTGKFYLFRAIYESKLPFLVVLGILNSVISLFYYFKVLKAAYFVEAEEGGPAFPVLSAAQQLAVQVCLWSNLVLGLWPGLIREFDRVASTLTQGN